MMPIIKPVSSKFQISSDRMPWKPILADRWHVAVGEQSLEEAIDEYEEKIEAEKGEDFKWLVSNKRVMIIYVVAKACERLKSADGAEIGRKFFLNCGISFLPDRTKDSFIRIKGVKDNKINFIGWEIAEEIVIEDNALVDSLCDDDELIEADDDDLLLLT
ncbi:hypothetical protein HZ326_23316 [Fusarium oxysporum f. sp. albedinis]|nr:hypothetical protein HZ326_23316 [Fusarium oxysporum f. sp. albedinis]